MKILSIVFVPILGVVFGLNPEIPAQSQTTQSGCPRIVFSSSDLSAFGGEIVEVEAALLGRPTGRPSYQWTVPIGTIKSGQGTSRVRITLPKVKKRKRIDLVLTIGGSGAASNCDTSSELPIFMKGAADWEHGISRLAALVANKDKIRIPCSNPKPPTTKPGEGEYLVNVIAIPRDIQNTLLSYNFWVSGGTIRRKGNTAIWDLSGASPGVYAVTANIDDGIGFAPSISRFITVEECPN